MQNKKKNAKKLPGFYIALCCCVLALGAAGYFSEQLSARKASTVAENVEIPTPPPTAEPITETLPPPEEVSVFSEDTPPEILTPSGPIPTEPPVTAEDYTEDNPDIEEVNASKNIEESFTIPANGEILQGYSQIPEFNKVMGDWRTHNGIDIQAAEGSEIHCAADGEIKSLKSTVYGPEIVITHSGGYETAYSQLTPADGIAEGKNVRSGDVIGTVGIPQNEAVTEAHLHFEVKKDGMFIDPMTLIG